VPSSTLTLKGTASWLAITFPGFTYTGGNLLIQTCFANDYNSPAGCQTFITSQGTNNYCNYYYSDGTTGQTSSSLANQILATTTAGSTSALDGGGISTSRPDVRLGRVSNPSWSWSIGSSTTASITVSPSTTTTYTATATQSNGCTSTASSIVTINPLPVLSGTTTSNVLCFGGATGSINGSASGASSPYTYSLNGTNNNSTGIYSGLSAGNYSLTATDSKGCSRTQSYTITQPTACSVSVSATNVSCNGGSNGSINFSATGGVSPYTYTINGTSGTSPRSGLSAGNYTIVSTDANGCTASTTITVSQPSALTVTATPAATSVCPGSSTTVNVSASGGTTPYSGTGIFTQGAVSNTYTVTDANSCIRAVSVSISQFAPPIVSISGTSPVCQGVNTILSANATAGSGTIAGYAWSLNGTSIFGATASSYSTSTAGTYSVTVTNSNGCSSTATFSLSVTTRPAQPSIACYETATFNTTTCQWDVTGQQPAQPSIACYETATFNTTTCSWVVTGQQPAAPTLQCYQTATFNTTTCQWDVNGQQPV
ncbi:MAG: hypothetical protein ACKOQ6_09560, partial [Bacteroidota bacterium]